ncbi:MAG: iron-containing alcohol dehydrogenase [Pseudomonadota bacterium]
MRLPRGSRHDRCAGWRLGDGCRQGGAHAAVQSRTGRGDRRFGKVLAPHRSLLVCVPTTAGTGSEISESAILSSRADSDVKLIYRSPEMTARIALLDPALTVSAPASVTAQSGYDAVTHAVEAYVSRAASLMSDPFAESALALLAHFLPIAWAEPEHRGRPRALPDCVVPGGDRLQQRESRAGACDCGAARRAPSRAARPRQTRWRCPP